jgi:ribosomal RNA-processing protein 8
VKEYLDKHFIGWRSNDEPIIEKEKSITKKSMKLKIETPTIVKQETNEERKLRNKSQLSELHKIYKSMNSENLHKKFNENLELWNDYHTISEKNEESFPEEEIPRNRIIQELNKIKVNRKKIVVDLGCGKAHISKKFKNDSRFEFMNYDHISFDSSVECCDISAVPLEENSVEIAILCLSMWGSNCKSYISEVYRILETCGKLYIIEPTKRWTSISEYDQPADKLKSLLIENGFQILEEKIEKFSFFVCIK